MVVPLVRHGLPFAEVLVRTDRKGGVERAVKST